MTTTEILLFGNDPENVHKIRHIIMNFGELLPPNYNRDHLPAKYIQMFMQYYGIKKGLEKTASEYFYQIYRCNPNNTLHNVTYQAIHSYKKEVKDNIDGCLTSFSKKLELLFYKTIPLKNLG